MRLWHIFLAVILTAFLLVLAKDPAGRVAVVVFITGVCELVCGLTAIMLLFQSLGSLGEADGPLEAILSLTATAVIIAGASYLIVGLFTVGIVIVQRVV